jgi:hypothetical protein
MCTAGRQGIFQQHSLLVYCQILCMYVCVLLCHTAARQHTCSIQLTLYGCISPVRKLTEELPKSSFPGKLQSISMTEGGSTHVSSVLVSNRLCSEQLQPCAFHVAIPSSSKDSDLPSCHSLLCMSPTDHIVHVQKAGLCNMCPLQWDNQ